MKTFEDLYAGYVIRDREWHMYVGPDSQAWRVALRQHARRFTKEEAMSYIEVTKINGVIEDAIDSKEPLIREGYVEKK